MTAARCSKSQIDTVKAGLLAGCCLVALAPLTPALAQSAPATGGQPAASGQTLAVPDIVVTAQKRSEKLQNVPIAITAVNSAELAAGGVHTTTDLNNIVPSLNFTTAIGAYGLPVIRGVGTTSHGPGVENPVATYIDGVYMVAASSALMTLSDVAQVAVLKGPQGTLFGRNSTGGLIQITTKTPSFTPEGDVQVSFGNVGYSDQSLYLTGPLTPDLAVNLAVSHEEQDQGWGKNLFNNTYVDTYNSWAARGKIYWRPSDRTNVTLSLDYATPHRADPADRNLALTYSSVFPFNTGPMAGGPWDINMNVQPLATSQDEGASLTVKHDFGPVQLVSISAYRDDKIRSVFDADETTNQILSIDINQKDNEFTQELQLLSTNNSRLSWVTGLFFMSSDAQYDPIVNHVVFLPGPQRTYAEQTLSSYAGFAQATYKIDPSTNLTAGIRYTDDQRTLYQLQTLTLPNGHVVPTGPFHFNKIFSSPTWRISLDHRFSPELMGYISYNHGFRSGTAFVPDQIPTTVLKPEIVDAYEVGLKSDLFDRRLRLDVAGFYYNYQNRQVLAIVGGFETPYDARGSVIYGVDADATFRITEDLTLNAGVSALHARYTDFPNALFTTISPNPFGVEHLFNASATGNALESTPDWTLNIGPSYRLRTSVGEFLTNLNYYHSDGWYAGPDNRARQPAYDTLAADITWTPSFTKHLTVRVWGRNLTNAVYATQLTETSYGDNRVTAPGRSFGVTLRGSF